MDEGPKTLTTEAPQPTFDERLLTEAVQALRTAKDGAIRAGQVVTATEAFKSASVREREAQRLERNRDPKAIATLLSAAHQYELAAAIGRTPAPSAADDPVLKIEANASTPSATFPEASGNSMAIPAAPNESVKVERADPPPVRSEVPPAIPQRVDPRTGINDALNRYRLAYQTMDVDALMKVYPTFGGGDQLQKRFADLREVAMALGNAAITLTSDTTATATCTYSLTFISTTGKSENTKPQRAEFKLVMSGGMWTIDSVMFR